jgi:hypothetical protein
MNKSQDWAKRLKGCLALPVTQSEGPNTDVRRSANFPRPVKWLGLFPSMAAMNKFLAQMNKSLDGGKATKKRYERPPLSGGRRVTTVVGIS